MKNMFVFVEKTVEVEKINHLKNFTTNNSYISVF